MAKQKDYDTAVIATDKNGKKTKYSSLKAASKATGLSERTIKSRAVNSGKSGKDKLIFEWVNPTTRKAFKAKQSRQKGNGWETTIVNKLKDIGYKGVMSSRSVNKRLDNSKVDIADELNELPIYIQAKNMASFPNYYKIERECNLKNKPFCIFYKKAYNDGTRSPEPLAIIPLEYFYKLISKNEHVPNPN